MSMLYCWVKKQTNKMLKNIYNVYTYKDVKNKMLKNMYNVYTYKEEAFF